MMIYRQQLLEAIEATAVHLPTGYSWLGRSAPALPRTVKRALTPKTARSYLLYSLQNRLYSDFYCKGTASGATDTTVRPPVMGLTPWVAGLSAANAGQGHWQGGWMVQAVEDGSITVHKNGLTLRTSPERCETTDSIQPGAEIRLRTERELLNMSPGFYMALSDAAFDQSEATTLVRIYWNLTPEGAVPLLQTATQALNGAGVPFQLKVLNDPGRFTRCDAAVLYFARDRYEQVAEIVSGIYPDVAPYLKPQTPAFTKPLAPGVGLAEDPGQGTSFGMHRCQSLAEALVQAEETGKRRPDERAQFVEECLRQSGINLDAPYLNTGSRDDYHFSPRALPRLFLVSKTEPSPAPLAPAAALESYLTTAHSLGRQLTESAIWYQDRCNWVGPVLDGTFNSYGPLGPDLYAGTSGAAWFMAHLSALTGDEKQVRRTALGAMRQALERAPTDESLFPLGLYVGKLGVAFAAVHVGMLLGDEETVEKGRRLLHEFLRLEAMNKEFDLLNGSAGAIIALTILKQVLGDESLLPVAMRLGDGLIASADKKETGYSWRTPSFSHQRNLTGLSHGTAGIACALLDLFQATGNQQYFEGAEMAFQYERSWFDRQAQNWPDFRSEPTRSGKKLTWPGEAYWCHGSAGIALSRLRAFEILGDPTYQAEAQTALAATLKMVETALRTGGSNYSLCHGLAGNAEVLFEGALTLGPGWKDQTGLCLQVAHAGIENYSSGNRPWPCGVAGTQTPGLMLGLAGIGYFYLRLYSQTVPSVLLFRPGAFVKPAFRQPAAVVR